MCESDSRVVEKLLAAIYGHESQTTWFSLLTSNLFESDSHISYPRSLGSHTPILVVIHVRVDCLQGVQIFEWL